MLQGANLFNIVEGLNPRIKLATGHLAL